MKETKLENLSFSERVKLAEKKIEDWDYRAYNLECEARALRAKSSELKEELMEAKPCIRLMKKLDKIAEKKR